MALASLLVKLGTAGLFVVLAQYVLAYLRSPLKRIPGPTLAKVSDLWRLFNAYEKKHITTQLALHRKYGDYVQLGPNVVSINDPNLVKTIYSTRGTFLKSDFYAINDAMQDGKVIQNLFGTRDNKFHSKYIRPVQKLYTFQAAKEYEAVMDKTLTEWYHQLNKRFVDGTNQGKACDIADWISFLTWDILGEMTFSKPFGFMEQAADIGGMLETAEKNMDYQSVIGQIPALDKWLAKNPRLASKFPAFAVTAGFCVERFMERMQSFEQFKGNTDFMNHFLAAKEEHPTVVTDNEVIGYMIINVLGGGDTTSITVKAIIYHALKNPGVHKRLVEELRSADVSHPASYTTLEKLQYLDACVKEGLRIHPVVGHILERVVPSTGLALNNGVTLPPGTVVGVNPWVVHRRADVYGERPDKFLPERWLKGSSESDADYEARIRRMNDADLSFGKGNRVCLGRPLALVEMAKIVGTLFAKYKIELEDPNAEWEVHPQWFVWPHKIKVKLSQY
ncbi:cytochrome P450 [Bimuria novae-zelandiae CBS 107.79]|uniref:Cytochrome P450 n=1 Tax=Bimuria novae-zelandiae CBS 107.79 TaxID=1447943 RepID=A0A6A5UTC7_9PLEO|nr:cytochrome P450 [Bimuria novae-zelandiae CBS 107.79]